MMRRVWITKEEIQASEKHFQETGWIDIRLSVPEPMQKVKLKFNDVEWVGHIWSAPEHIPLDEMVDYPLATHWKPLDDDWDDKESTLYFMTRMTQKEFENLRGHMPVDYKFNRIREFLE